MESNEILIFLNTDLSKSTKIELRSNLSLREIVDDMKQKFNICHTIGCRLIDSSGGEIDDDDVEYLNPREPLFLSQGEELNLESSTVLYEYVRQLGKGGFGNVALCRNRITNEEVAVKSIPLKSLKSPDDINRIYNEIAVLRDLRHPNIVRLLDTFTSNDQICFVMEYCSGGELYDFIVENQPMEEDLVHRIACQICEAVRYCHYSKIIHRDLKLENILMFNKFSLQVKICDFGISGMFNAGSAGEKSEYSTLVYAPPEIVTKRDNRASPALDIWSIGCILYCMLTCHHPFASESVKRSAQLISEVRYSQLPNTVSRLWHRLIRGCLRLYPQQRWDMNKIIEFLGKYKREISSDSEIEEIDDPSPIEIRTSNHRFPNREERQSNLFKATKNQEIRNELRKKGKKQETKKSPVKIRKK